MSSEVWEVVDVKHHDDGGVTLTMRNENGVTLVENYPPGAFVTKVVDEDEQP